MNIIISLYDAIAGALSKGRSFPLLLARISLGAVFVVSGWGKLHNIPKVVNYFTDLGIPWPEFQAHLVALTEFGCGALILAGLLTRLASIPLVATMIVAILTAKTSDIHGAADFFALDEFIYIVLLIFLIVSGAGIFSLDTIASRFCRKNSELCPTDRRPVRRTL